VLKRQDEKWVTEKAYDNPRFVEDLSREVTLRLKRDPRIKWFSVEVENFESIHAHNAYAYIEQWVRNGDDEESADGKERSRRR
jgi:GTP cyclohydrolase I